MAKLILKFDGRVLKESVVGADPVVIGRLPNNGLIIDNPAVSSHHARVYRQGESVIIEDLRSTNGTFVNEQPITRHVLRDGDRVLIGKHELVFSPSDDVPGDASHDNIPDFGGTMMLNTRQQRQLLAKSGMEASRPSSAARVTMNAREATPRVAVLTVVGGRADQSEYTLSGPTSLVGKSDSAAIRLKGWFKPRLAASIARRGDAYAVTPIAGRTRVNGQRIDARCDLKDGDVLEVSGVKLQFRSKRIA